ncbi:MAG TPA: DNA mismatch repair endonuclease MutL [Arsenophonus apicola]|uniref:DNA mismatch repair endonuclease MutL n=1 Tax=Arsenophonus apicola TaxID=2879119 RepID=UPI001CDC6DDE|nr:DNA mismatch repair endonuclease MutL [Arsenophonus apicola]UBX29339.1 DNA mismatch repair endonuclease MutL [Arsenophonus apicola]
MSAIQILSPQLANQIAAGEVVERPSSVVKELVENSLDAGASRIDIEIERGGAKLIRIHDNGSGIAKQDLTLALERHATSKIATLEDLAAIMSMGFRGEALASISSVSRLILTSRVETQTEAWQAYAEGREMNVTLKPAAHPIGTTVEVLDLFYNTPARRKFLRTEKTEFSHIDEVVRRIALARFDVAINLHHNGKLVRQYRATKGEEQYERRLAAICGSTFMQNALQLYWQHGDLAIKGWITNPYLGKTAEIKYCYVNGRMMRDRLINHAIRQAYADRLPEEQQAAYVLYLTIDPHQVDVNVHPAKQEVRFHQARLVHDFIYQGVNTVLSQQQNQKQFNQVAVSSKQETHPVLGLQNRLAAGENFFASNDSKPHLVVEEQKAQAITELNATSQISPSETTAFSCYNNGKIAKKIYNKKQGELYQQLMQNEPCKQEKIPLFPERNPIETEKLAVKSIVVEKNDRNYTFGKILTIYSKNFAFIESSFGIGLLSLAEAERYLKRSQLIPTDQGLKSQPLLIPIKLALTEKEIETFYRVKVLLTTLGFDINISHNKATIRAVSCPLRSQNLAELFPKLLEYLAQNSSCQVKELVVWLADHLVNEKQVWTVAQGVQLLADLERVHPELVKEPPKTLLQLIDFESLITALTHE